MKSRITLLITSFVLVAAAIAGPAVSAESSIGSGTTSSSPPSTSKDDIKTRIESHKTAFKVKLDAAAQTRIKSKCKIAQGHIKILAPKIDEVSKGRTKAYDEMISRLTKLIEKLKLAEVDTTTIEQRKTELNTKIITYKSDLASFKLALSDLRDEDCATDPDGFQAALEAARDKRAALSTTVTGIRSYVKDTIKATLGEIRNSIEDNKTSNTSGSLQ